MQSSLGYWYGRYYAYCCAGVASYWTRGNSFVGQALPLWKRDVMSLFKTKPIITQYNDLPLHVRVMLKDVYVPDHEYRYAIVHVDDPDVLGFFKDLTWAGRAYVVFSKHNTNITIVEIPLKIPDRVNRRVEEPVLQFPYI